MRLFAYIALGFLLGVAIVALVIFAIKIYSVGQFERWHFSVLIIVILGALILMIVGMAVWTAHERARERNKMEWLREMVDTYGSRFESTDEALDFFEKLMNIASSAERTPTETRGTEQGSSGKS